MESIFKLGILLRMTDMVSGPISRVKMQLDDVASRAKQLQSTFDRFKDYGAWIAGAGVAGAIGLGIAVTQFANLEEAQLGLRTLLMDSTGQVGAEYGKLNKLAENLGTSLPGSTKDMIEMFTALREQGVQTNVILGGMGEAAAKFAVLMKVPFAQAATHVAKFSEALGIADREAVPFMDILQRLKGAAGVNVNDMAESVKYLGSTLKTLRVQGLEAGQDVAAAIGMMATSSIEGSQAGTNFAMAMSEFAQLDMKLGGKKMQQEIAPLLNAKGIKLNLFDTSGSFVGIRAMMGELEKLRSLKDNDKLLVLSKLFGEQASRPLSVFIDKGVAGFDEMLLRMKNQADMQTKINVIMSGTKMQWETLTGTVSNVGAHIGGVVAQTLHLDRIMARLNTLAGRLDNWIVANPKTAGIIAGLALALTGAALAAGTLLLAIGIGGTLFLKMSVGAGMLTQGLSLLSLALKGIPAGIYAIDVALVSSGWGLIIIAIGLTVAQLMWAHTKFESFRISLEFFYFTLGWLLGMVVKVGLGFYNAFAHPLEFLQAVIWAFTTIDFFGPGKNTIDTFIAGMKSRAQAAYGAVVEIFNSIRQLLPFSDAKEGPLSQLTLSGSRIMTTMGEGIAGAAGGLQKTMATALAGAALTTSIAVNPAFATIPSLQIDPPAVSIPAASAQAAKQAPSGDNRDGRKVIIQNQNLYITLPNVTDGKSFTQQLQALIEGFDVN